MSGCTPTVALPCCARKSAPTTMLEVQGAMWVDLPWTADVAPALGYTAFTIPAITIARRVVSSTGTSADARPR